MLNADIIIIYKDTYQCNRVSVDAVISLHLHGEEEEEHIEQEEDSLLTSASGNLAFNNQLSLINCTRPEVEDGEEGKHGDTISITSCDYA